jgi:hypothetical protein
MMAGVPSLSQALGVVLPEALPLVGIELVRLAAAGAIV